MEVECNQPRIIRSRLESLQTGVGGQSLLLRSAQVERHTVEYLGVVVNVAVVELLVSELFSLRDCLLTYRQRVYAAVEVQLREVVVGSTTPKQGRLFCAADIYATILLLDCSAFVQYAELGGEAHMLASFTRQRAILINDLTLHNNLVALYSHGGILVALQTYEHIESTLLRGGEVCHYHIIYGRGKNILGVVSALGRECGQGESSAQVE